VTQELALGAGYAGLFAVCFLAATVLPLGSEAVVALMPAAGYDHMGVFAVATTGNVLGALANYGAGRWGGAFLRGRVLRGREGALARAERVFARFGAPALLLSWLPGVGDPLTVVGGLLRLNLASFAFWVTLGKAGRYAAVLWLAGLAAGRA
jgi:membrane protein YqaA with SNARE-associated domain